MSPPQPEASSARGRAFSVAWAATSVGATLTALLCTILPVRHALPAPLPQLWSLAGSPLDTLLLALLDALVRGAAILHSVHADPPAEEPAPAAAGDGKGDRREVEGGGSASAGGGAGVACAVATGVTATLCSLKIACVAWLGAVSPPSGLASYPLPWPLLPAAVLLLAVPVLSHASGTAVAAWRAAAAARRDAGLSDEERPLLAGADGGEPSGEPPSAPAPPPAAKAGPVPRATVAALLRLSAPDGWLLGLGFVCGTAAALGSALIPRYVGKMIGYAALEGDLPRFHRAARGLIGVAGFTAVFTGARGAVFSLCTARLNIRVRERLFAALMAQEVGWYDVVKTGDISSRLSADTTTMADQVALNLNVFVRSVVQSAMILGFMFAASWRLTTVTFVIVPATVVVSKVYGSYYRKLAKATQDTLAGANTVAEECLSSMTTVRSFAAEHFAERDYRENLGRYYAIQMKECAIYSVYAASSFVMLPSLATVATLWFGGWLVLNGQFPADGLVSFMLYQQTLSGTFQTIGDVFSGLTAAVGAADKVFQIMHREPRVPPPGALRPEAFEGSLELADVRLSYPARPDVQVLRGLSFAVAPGEVVALVGPSGSGKSSVVKLLQRFYLPDSGSVLVDGRDVGAYDARWLRRHVAMVGQEPVLYARSILENIRYGIEEGEEGYPSEEAVREAAMAANAHEFIERLPEGYATQCGEKGVQLSGGQKQRVAIARALVRRPRVLLLDEATSALDADSESVVQSALDDLMHERGHTVLVIAHRLSTVQDADRILTMQEGRVAEAGSHEELVRLGGVYAKLVMKQLSRAQASSASLAAMARGAGGAEGGPP